MPIPRQLGRPTYTTHHHECLYPHFQPLNFIVTYSRQPSPRVLAHPRVLTPRDLCQGAASGGSRGPGPLGRLRPLHTLWGRGAGHQVQGGCRPLVPVSVRRSAGFSERALRPGVSGLETVTPGGARAGSCRPAGLGPRPASPRRTARSFPSEASALVGAGREDTPPLCAQMWSSACRKARVKSTS